MKSKKLLDEPLQKLDDSLRRLEDESSAAIKVNSDAKKAIKYNKEPLKRVINKIKK